MTMNLTRFFKKLSAGGALLVLFLLAICEAKGAPVELVVAADGSAKYRTVQEAVMAVPAGTADSPVVIRIRPGTYREVVYVQREKRFFKFVGEDAAKTVITYDLNANIKGVDGKPIGTFRTPSVQIDADDFTAENVTIEPAKKGRSLNSPQATQ